MIEKQPTPPKPQPANSLEEILVKDPDLLTPEEITVLKREMLARMTEQIAASNTGKTSATDREAHLPPHLREVVEFVMPLAAGGYQFELNGVPYRGKCRAPRHVFNQLCRIYQENAMIERERLENRGVIGEGKSGDFSMGHRLPEAVRVA